MDFPKFTDFLAVLNEEAVAEIIKDADNAAKLAVEAPDIHDKSRPALARLSSSFQISLGLLAT